LFLKGERCYTPKCAMERRPYAPGMHGRRREFRRKLNEYGVQLREKQKVRRMYGVMERQFRRYFRQALKAKGMTGVVLLQTLERRLDNVVYRMGFASSRAQARQLVTHGHFEVNGRKTDIPSFLVKPGDEIAVRAKSKKNAYFQAVAEELDQVTPPEWISLDREAMRGRILALPTREDVDVPVNEHLIVEYYSR